MTSACVSPRVNSDEPWVRGSTLLRISIGTHGARVAAVDARLAGQDLATDQLGFDLEQQAFDFDLVELDAFGLQCGEHVGW